MEGLITFKTLQKIVDLSEISNDNMQELIDYISNLNYKHHFLMNFEKAKIAFPHKEFATRLVYFGKLVEQYFNLFYVNTNIQEESLDLMKQIATYYLNEYRQSYDTIEEGREMFKEVLKIAKKLELPLNYTDLEDTLETISLISYNDIPEEFIYMLQECLYELLRFYDNESPENYHNDKIRTLIEYLESIQEWHQNFPLDAIKE